MLVLPSKENAMYNSEHRDPTRFSLPTALVFVGVALQAVQTFLALLSYLR